MGTAAQDHLLAQLVQARQKKLEAHLSDSNEVMTQAISSMADPSVRPHMDIDTADLDPDLKTVFDAGVGYCGFQAMVLQLQSVRILRQIAKSLADIPAPDPPTP